MHPQLAAIVDEFTAAQANLHRLAARVAPDQWTKRPDPKSWSVAECVEHLNLTARAFLPLLERAIADARALGAPAPARYRRDLMGWLLWKTMPPPVRLRVPTAPSFIPGADRSPAELLAEFDRLQAEQIRLTGAADGLPLQKIRVPSPFNAKASYNAFSALSILPPHQERHIWQAARALGSGVP
jgi:hypothetical protein